MTVNELALQTSPEVICRIKLMKWIFMLLFAWDFSRIFLKEIQNQIPLHHCYLMVISRYIYTHLIHNNEVLVLLLLYNLPCISIDRIDLFLDKSSLQIIPRLFSNKKDYF